ncbi:fumarylacetoacetate hydrolase family protein [Streptomyces olivaceoviridis]
MGENRHETGPARRVRSRDPVAVRGRRRREGPAFRRRRPDPWRREARYLTDEAAAAACVAGYAISNDVSEREFQPERGGQWDKGKNCETFNPLRPWLLTADEVPAPQARALRLRVNGRSPPGRQHLRHDLLLLRTGPRPQSLHGAGAPET